MTPPLTRRTLLGALASSTTLLAACSGPGETSARPAGAATTSPEDDGPWSFTDDRGTTVELPARPQRVVAFSTSLAALVELGVVPVGVFAWAPLADDAQLRHVDPSVLESVEVVGEVWGEVNLEKLLALRPDVLVTGWDATDDSLYGIAPEQREAIERIAPVVGLDNTAPLTDQLTRYQDLATALGADLSEGDVLEEREEFNRLVGEVEDVAAARPGLRVMAVGSTGTGMNVAQPAPNPDLSFYESLGVQMVVPDGKGTFWWQELGGEALDRYPADVLLVDARSGQTERRTLEQLPLWSALPAVAAGQVFAWHAYDPPAYRFYIEALTELLTALQGSQVVA